MSILTADEVRVTEGVMSILTVDEVGVTGGDNTYCRRGWCHRVCRTHRCGMDWHSFPLVLLVFSPALRDKTQTQHTVLWTHPGTKKQDENTVHNSVNSHKQIKRTDTSRGQDCIKSPRRDKLLDTNTDGHDWRDSHKQVKQPDTTSGQDCRTSLRQDKWLDTNIGQHWLNSNRANSYTLDTNIRQHRLISNRKDRYIRNVFEKISYLSNLSCCCRNTTHKQGKWLYILFLLGTLHLELTRLGSQALLTSFVF